jgi:hypothetical protein
MKTTDLNLQIISDNFLATHGSFNYFLHEYNRFNVQLFIGFVNAFLEVKLDDLATDEKNDLQISIIHMYNNFMRDTSDSKEKPYHNYKWDAVEIFELMLQLLFTNSQSSREGIKYNLEQIVKTQNDELTLKVEVKPLFEKLINGQIEVEEFLTQFETIAVKVKTGQYEFLQPPLELIQEQIQIAKDKKILDKNYVCSLVYGYLQINNKF